MEPTLNKAGMATYNFICREMEDKTDIEILRILIRGCIGIVNDLMCISPDEKNSAVRLVDERERLNAYWQASKRYLPGFVEDIRSAPKHSRPTPSQHV